MHAVNAAIRSEASPVFVVTGYHDAEMQEILENIDVNILYNPAYRSGIKTSIALGLKSIPSFCEGAVIMPADMPNITEKDINLLIASFKRGQEKPRTVCLLITDKSQTPFCGEARCSTRRTLFPKMP
ncbi:MAG: NTP transferase domain-containing protein [Alphaproteobacteria bacterium]